VDRSIELSVLGHLIRVKSALACEHRGQSGRFRLPTATDKDTSGPKRLRWVGCLPAVVECDSRVNWPWSTSRGGGNLVQRKRRTRQHVIEELGVNFLERQVLRRRHQLQRPSLREYGWDAVMFHFSPDGSVENGEVRFQVKATDNLKTDRGIIRCRVTTGDVHYWYWEDPPFVLVVYDAEKGRAFWLQLRGYIDDHPGLLELDQETITMRVPITNKVTLRAVDQWRQLSLDNAR